MFSLLKILKFSLIICKTGVMLGLVLGFFFLVCWGGVRLSPLGTSATNWPIVPARDDR
jgi:hypothetical protein